MTQEKVAIWALVKEAAQVLEIPLGTAATRQRRALQLLRLELGEEGEE